MASRYFTPLFALLAALAVKGDETIYSDDAISSTWQDWSWSSTILYNATNIAEGSTSISVNSTAYAALSLYDTAVFASTYAGLKFDIAGDNPDVSLQFNDVNNNVDSASIPLSAFGFNLTSSNFTTILVNFNDIPPSGTALGNASWERITWQAGGNGAVYNLDNIILVSEIVITPEFLTAEPLAANVIAVTTQGAVDLSAVSVILNGKPVAIESNTTVVPPDSPSASITYFELASDFVPGNLTITAGNSTFDHVLPASTPGSVDQSVNFPISPRIYGMNFPTDSAYVSDLGITISRWGGNAVTAYNPFLDSTNAGNDWYFENRASDNGNADDWIGWVQAAGSDTLLTIPALDWVAKDNTSYSYPSSLYPEQEAFDPYNGLAGDGLFPNGSVIQPPTNQTLSYVPWNTTVAQLWLSSLVNPPTIVTIDNEMEIASSTHQDMHPDPMDYDEELARVINFSTIAKAALPNVQVAAPSTCAWWYYWTSVVGFTDNAAHGNEDFIPWFLDQMNKTHTTSGQRLLDFLDIHYYFAADTSANDAAAKALRLRMTRSLWDTTYVDESYIGTSTPQNNEPNATIVMLIPRMQALINEHYPGTKLSISEWDSTDDSDITGGLVTADSLGIFGRFKLDSATYWSDADRNSPAGLAFWLYNGYGTHFGSSSAQVNVPSLNPDLLGVYAGTNGGTNVSLVVVNKDPSNHVALNLTGIPAGTYFLRHFGGQSGIAKYQTTITVDSSAYIVVPSYAAVYLQEIKPSAPAPAPTTTAPAPTKPTAAPCATHYGQCGGANWAGPTCCATGFKCVDQNPFYYQCL